MIETCTVKINKSNKIDTLNILLNLTNIYTGWLSYEANASKSLKERIISLADSGIDDAIEVFIEHFGAYVNLKIT